MITTDISLAAKHLADCKVVAIPTETVYGLAALVSCPDAVRQVFDIKNRPHDHPLILHLSTSAVVDQWGTFNDDARKLAVTCWPGPLTLLVPRTRKVPDVVTGGRDSVAIRVPSHPTAQQLLTEVNDAVVAPSANTFGHVSPTSAQHVLDDLGGAIDVILDGGMCEIGIESTIVDCTVSPPQIVRPGAITQHDVETVLGVGLDDMSGPSRAPGMLASHYAPRVPIELMNSLTEAQERISLLAKNNKNYMLLFDDDVASYAVHLYSKLRQAEINFDGVIAVLPKNAGVGIAVCDRLQKAAAPK